jgi:hypothetical protein
MDQNPQPSSAPTPVSSPAEISPALPGSPETRPAEPTTPTPAGAPDPYAGYANLDYEALLQEHPIEGMDVKELGSVFPAAHRAIAEFGAPSLEAVLELTAAGDDPNLMRGLAAFHRDYQSLIGEARKANAEIREMSAQLGEREPRIADVPPLTGQALEAKIGELISRYLPATGSRKGLEALGFFRDPAVRKTLTAMAQETHRLQSALQTASGLRRQMQDRWDAPTTLKTLPDGRRYTRQELQDSYSELMQRFMEADKRGDLLAKERIKAQLMKVGKAAYS